MLGVGGTRFFFWLCLHPVFLMSFMALTTNQDKKNDFTKNSGDASIFSFQILTWALFTEKGQWGIGKSIYYWFTHLNICSYMFLLWGQLFFCIIWSFDCLCGGQKLGISIFFMKFKRLFQIMNIIYLLTKYFRVYYYKVHHVLQIELNMSLLVHIVFELWA